MSEMEVRKDAQPVVAASSLVTWAQEAGAAYRVAQSLVKTPFCPQSLSTPEAAAAAILAGAEVGLRPMAALRSINIIQGTPAMQAIAMRALAQSHGHELWVEEQTDAKAVVAGRRADSERVQKSTWTIDRAKNLGLTSKDNWRKQPGAMLIARATSEVCRLVAADVLLGLAYSAEELDGDDPQPEAPKRRTARRQPVGPPAPEVEPPLEPPVEVEEVDGSFADDMLPDVEVKD
jgi:hypothetical protein